MQEWYSPNNGVFFCFSAQNNWANLPWGNKINEHMRVIWQWSNKKRKFIPIQSCAWYDFNHRDKVWNGVPCCLRIYPLQDLVDIAGLEVTLSNRRHHRIYPLQDLVDIASNDPLLPFKWRGASLEEKTPDLWKKQPPTSTPPTPPPPSLRGCTLGKLYVIWLQ
jgi:hypothetical protein